MHLLDCEMLQLGTCPRDHPQYHAKMPTSPAIRICVDAPCSWRARDVRRMAVGRSMMVKAPFPFGPRRVSEDNTV